MIANTDRVTHTTIASLDSTHQGIPHTHTRPLHDQLTLKSAPSQRTHSATPVSFRPPRHTRIGINNANRSLAGQNTNRDVKSIMQTVNNDQITSNTTHYTAVNASAVSRAQRIRRYKPHASAPLLVLVLFRTSVRNFFCVLLKLTSKLV